MLKVVTGILMPTDGFEPDKAFMAKFQDDRVIVLDGSMAIASSTVNPIRRLTDGLRYVKRSPWSL